VYEHELLPINQRDHKLDLIRPILRTYPDLPFLLIGDSGEVDAEIYGQIVREHPGRILAVYIRDLDPRVEKNPLTALAEEVLAAGSSLILAPDSLVMARHAAEAGWIQGHLLAVIEAEVQMDRGEF
jgi:phosphatidate phosphatase APP1